MAKWKRVQNQKQSQAILKQKELLEKIKALLESRMAADKAKLAEMLEVLEQIKHGGTRGVS